MIPITTKTDQLSQQTQVNTVTPIKPVAAVTSVLTAADSRNTSHDFIQGQKYQAVVDTRLSNGNFNVLISNKLFQMHLPEKIKPGDKIELVFISHQPKLRFVLQPENFINTIKNNATISTTGRFLNGLTQDTGQSTPSSMPINNTSILTSSSIKSPELPLLLQKTIQQSGLFYESHLSKWINGKHKLEELQQEPQGKIKSASSTVTSATTSAMPVNSQSLSLVQQQLLTLETSHIVWNGEIWNGQQIQWHIYEDNATHKNIDGNATNQWKTKLSLTLPELGKITISLSLNFREIRVSMNTESNQTAQLLKTNQIHLKKNMHTAGLAIQSLDIHHND
ncbi:MAG: flagellar hook-length control protein FliK [Nitrosomonas sp.]|nr:flagellar hook-length control protein FliK [Nitrosomonas sp.]